MGKVMSQVMAKVRPADGSAVSAMVRQKLGAEAALPVQGSRINLA